LPGKIDFFTRIQDPRFQAGLTPLTVNAFSLVNFPKHCTKLWHEIELLYANEIIIAVTVVIE